MLVNFFKNLWDVIAGVAQTIWDLFTTTADAVDGLGLKVFASTIGAILNALINAICQFMANISQSVVGMFQIDIGTGSSTFEMVVGSFSWAIATMQLIGLVLLFFILMTSLARLMVSPNQNSETPQRLIISGIATGIGIHIGPQLVVFVGDIFSRFYNMILSVANIADIDFEKFAQSINTAIVESNHFASGGLAKTQINTLVSTLFLFLILLAVFIAYIKFILEVVQRYVVSGALLVTSPAAIALAASKATRKSFARWARMVFSQFILMCTNTIFLSVFLTSLRDAPSVLSSLPTGSQISGVVLFGVLLYGILHVGMRFDSHLKSLGLSIAETGSNVLASTFSDLIMMGELMAFNSGTRLMAKAGRAIGSVVKSQAPKVFDTGKRAKDILSTDARSGLYTAQSINEAIKGISSGKVEKNPSVGESFLSNSNSLPNKLKSKFDAKTCTIQNGCMRMSTIPNARGKTMSADFIPLSVAQEKGIPTDYGRRFSFGGETYLAIPNGDKTLSSQFLSYNPIFDKTTDNPDAFTSLVSRNGRPNGVYRTVTPDMSTAGRTPTTVRLPDRNMPMPATPGAPQSFYRLRATCGKEEFAIIPSKDGVTIASMSDDNAKNTWMTAENFGSAVSQKQFTDLSTTHFNGKRISIVAEVASCGTTPPIAAFTDTGNIIIDMSRPANENIPTTATKQQSEAQFAVWAEKKASQIQREAVFYSHNALHLPQDFDAAVQSNIILHEFVPTSCYKADSALNAKIENHAGMDYYHYELPLAKNERGEWSGLCDNPAVPERGTDKFNWLREQFPAVAKNGYTVLSGAENNIIFIEKDGSQFAMAPASDFAIQENQEEAETVYASNGTRYTIVPIENESEVNTIFQQRKSLFDPLAMRTSRNDSIMNDVFLPNETPEIVGAAIRRKTRRNK